uniref:Uncharacterized protein LOC113793865 n=1 Tax=Dermatophagoides pteronyssinus TaxID=6956 RepID=A0A6P6Y3X6_DERPT|nr:uncharacterized protein LOC113793865 [Dermatophagoides pteronyssinus]
MKLKQKIVVILAILIAIQLALLYYCEIIGKKIIEKNYKKYYQQWLPKRIIITEPITKLISTVKSVQNSTEKKQNTTTTVPFNNNNGSVIRFFFSSVYHRY